MCHDCKMKINNPRKGTGRPGIINKCGYYTIQVNNKVKLLHRHIMEEFLNRKLEKDEVVHHVDGNKLNNDIENLELMLSREHHRLHSPSEKMKKLSRLGNMKRGVLK